MNDMNETRTDTTCSRCGIGEGGEHITVRVGSVAAQVQEDRTLCEGCGWQWINGTGDDHHQCCECKVWKTEDHYDWWVFEHTNIEEATCLECGGEDEGDLDDEPEGNAQYRTSRSVALRARGGQVDD